jgi:hypothetical protein
VPVSHPLDSGGRSFACRSEAKRSQSRAEADEEFKKARDAEIAGDTSGFGPTECYEEAVHYIKGATMTDIPRLDIPSTPTRIEMFRAFRGYLEKTTGKKLATAWYADSPEEKPGLYEDQPEVLAALKKKGEENAT